MAIASPAVTFCLLSKAARWKSVRSSSFRSDSILPSEKRLMGRELTGVPPFTTNSPRVPLGRYLFLAADLRWAISHGTDVPRRE